MSNLYKQDTQVNRNQRNQLHGHNSFVVWFTGLSGSGKSTIAATLQVKLYDMKINTYMLDGDNIRLGLNSDLDFSETGRKENIRRIAEVAKLFTDAGSVTLCSFISPYIEEREKAKSIVSPENFLEVYVKCNLEECEKRDVKGLYERARKGEIKNFTGIDSPYEEPENPDIEIDTADLSVEESVELILNKIKSRL
ncbi:MAG: adenylyl-sulfate kinase [Bacteroidetes bacterium]|nr:MAG: adenylyl-sulfate kinase [Bacteroidota bacterium]